MTTLKNRLRHFYPIIPPPIRGACTVCPRERGSLDACACYASGWAREFAVLDPTFDDRVEREFFAAGRDRVEKQAS